jgi:membrane protease YdiL (CAAX protease family)
LIVGVAVAMAAPPITHYAIMCFGANIYSPAVLLHVMPHNRREWLFVPLAFVPAVILEELLFRSLLLGGFGAFMPPALLALAWSIIFGLMHSPQGALGMVIATALGLLLSGLFLTTQSLVAPCLAHYVINLVQLVWAAHDQTLMGKLMGEP